MVMTATIKWMMPFLLIGIDMVHHFIMYFFYFIVLILFKENEKKDYKRLKKELYIKENFKKTDNLKEYASDQSRIFVAGLL